MFLDDFIPIIINVANGVFLRKIEKNIYVKTKENVFEKHEGVS